VKANDFDRPNKVKHTVFMTGRNSAVGTTPGYGLDGPGFGFRIPGRTRFLSSSHNQDLYNGYSELFPRG
jgi:hypothetical protein